MSNTVRPTPAIPDRPVEKAKAVAALAPTTQDTVDKTEAHIETTPPHVASPEDPIDQSQYRLVIEEDQATGAFVYKTIDRNTGEVVLQFPREEVLKLKEQKDYKAGAVIRTTA